MKRSFSLCLMMGGFLLSGVASASGPSVKDAAGREGCESIPYENIRRTCTDKSREVEDWCKSSSREISCDSLNPDGISRKIENVKRKIADLKRERDEVGARLGSATDDGERRDLEDRKKTKESEIYELEKKVEKWENDLGLERRAVDDRIYNGERCVGFREEVARAFADAKSSMKSESESEIRPYAELLVSKWEAGEPGHATAIRNYKEAVDKCKRMK